MKKSLAKLFEIRQELESLLEDSDTLDIPEEYLKDELRYCEILENALDSVLAATDTLSNILDEIEEQSYEQNFDV